VSASALCKKSTAAEIGIDIYNQVFNNTPAVSKKMTLEKLMLNLDRICKTTTVSSCFLFNSELSVLVGRSGHSELMDFLTDVYGSPNTWINETKGKGIDTLKNVFVNFLGCTTPKDLAVMPSTMIDGGFAGRVIFVYSEDPRPPIHDPNKYFTEDIYTLREDLIHDLEEISQITGEYVLDTEADVVFKDIYDANYYNRDTDFRLHPYQGRKGEHLIKLSMVIAASHSNNLVIEARHIKAANMFLEQIEKNLPFVFSGVAYSSNATSKHADKFIDLIRKEPNNIIKHSKALNRLYHYMDKDGFRLLTETLEESGVIEITKIGQGKAYKLKREV